MMFKKVLPIFFFFTFVAPMLAQSEAGRLDKNLENLSWSGFLRTRGWFIDAPTPTDTSGLVQKVSFQDLFFRNRFTLKVLPNLKIYTLFDIGTIKFGDEDTNRETGATLGSPQAKILAKNIYFQFRPIKDAIITAGLQPFALPGGHILAKDGAGIKYQHRLLKGRLNPYAIWIKAFENSDTDVNNNNIKNDNFDHNIFVLGSKVSIGRDFNSELYYVYSEDLNQLNVNKNTSPMVRNWVGMHSKWLLGNFSVKWATIVNWGFIQTDVTATEPDKIDLSAALWELELGYSIGDLLVSLVTEGATGDASNDRNKHSFQGIFASHGFSNVLIDNSGGVAIRNGGQLFGLHGYGLKLEYLLFAKLALESKFIHFRTIYNEQGRGTHFGDEFDFKAKYTVLEKISFFFTSGIFWPSEAYKVFINGYQQKPILEFMLGAQINY